MRTHQERRYIMRQSLMVLIAGRPGEKNMPNLQRGKSCQATRRKHLACPLVKGPEQKEEVEEEKEKMDSLPDHSLVIDEA